MLFKRRTPQGFSRRMRESLWPSMGWRRTVDYFYHRVFRVRQSPHQVTGGLAIGAAISFTPLIGTHFFQSVVLALATRTNVLAAIVGTAFGNPWTFPILFWAAYETGAGVFVMMGAGDLIALPDPVTWRVLLDNPLRLFLPMLVGGYVCAILFAPLAYGLLYYPVKMIQDAYHARRDRRVEERRRS